MVVDIVRLTPAYGFMILFWACLTLYLYNGPIKPAHTDIADGNCPDYWWTALLYINNVIEPTKLVSILVTLLQMFENMI